MRKVVGVTLLAAVVFSLVMCASEQDRVEPVALERLQSNVTGYHYYTTNQTDKQNKLASHNFDYRGMEGWVLKTQIEGTIPLYHIYKGPADNDPHTQHVYTVRLSEVRNATGNQGFSGGAIIGYVSATQTQDTVPFLRFISKDGFGRFYSAGGQPNASGYSIDYAGGSPGYEGFIWKPEVSFPLHGSNNSTTVWWSVAGVTAIAGLIAALASMVSALRKRKD